MFDVNHKRTIYCIHLKFEIAKSTLIALKQSEEMLSSGLSKNTTKIVILRSSPADDCCMSY